MKIELYFDKGTLVLKNVPETLKDRLPGVKWDGRTRTFRAPAHFYRDIILELRDRKISYEDAARQFEPQEFPLKNMIIPRYYQQEAVDAWEAAGGRGVVTLPTGAGKTILAVMLINRAGRPTIVHVPTIDLMHQWYGVLKHYFAEEIGLLGGGYKELQAITVATYDSALLHVSSKGNQFGMAVYDECHHLPGEQYQYTALSNIAPFRLGLTATPERADGKETLLYNLLGNICYQADIRELEGSTLAPYRVVTLQLELSKEEQVVYNATRKQYTEYLKKEQINMGTPNGWNYFLWKTSRSAEGREVFKAYLTQKRLSQAASNKIEAIWQLLREHRGDRILIFTQDNEMAYRIGKRFFLPVLTHHTKLKEREAFLQAFRSGEYSVLVTSKVLNEGVDVPEANIAIIVSGSGSVREHVQRLGRILRARPGKEAILYELVAKGTGEHFVNKRRRQHHAYKKN